MAARARKPDELLYDSLTNRFVAVNWSCNIAAIYEKTNEDSIIITLTLRTIEIVGFFSYFIHGFLASARSLGIVKDAPAPDRGSAWSLPSARFNMFLAPL